MRFSLTFEDADTIESVTIDTWLNGESVKAEETYKPESDTMVVRNLGGSTTVKIKTKNNKEYDGKITFDGRQIAYAYADEQVIDNTALHAFTGAWADVHGAFKENDALLQRLRGGIQIRGLELTIPE